MSAMQRTKGAGGERELARLLQEHLGIPVNRNLQQTRQGGADLIDVPGWAIEVKRAANLRGQPGLPRPGWRNRPVQVCCSGY